MNFIKSLFVLTFSFQLIVSCGGNSSYPTTSTITDETSAGSSAYVTDLYVSDYDSCQYYGLKTGSSSSNCYEYGTSGTDIALSALRSTSGTSTTIYSDSNFNSNSNSGFVGANNVLQIAEAQSLLENLSKTTDGSDSDIAVVGSGINTLSSSSLNTGTSYNYGYLYRHATYNIETTKTIESASGGGSYLDDEATFETYANADHAYSIYNKNSLEAFSPDQALNNTNNIIYNDLYKNITTTTKYNIDSSNDVSLFLYNVITTTDDNNEHIGDTDSQFEDLYSDFNNLYIANDLNSFVQSYEDISFLKYENIGFESSSTFCTAASYATCTKNNHIFMTGVTQDSLNDPDTHLDSWFYQYSIFEYAHNDVANGTALAAIIGTTGDTEIEGSASGAEINSYKTQFYHRKLMEVEGGYMDSMDGTYMDNVLEDNTGAVLYDALYAAQADNTVVLLNNQYRNYTSTMTYDETVTDYTSFTISYVVEPTANSNYITPTDLTEIEEFDVYVFQDYVAYLGSNSIGNDSCDLSSCTYSENVNENDYSNFVAGNFASDFADSDIYSSNSNYSNSGTYRYLNDTNVKKAYNSNVSAIANLLSDDNNDNIYVIPTDNSFFMDLINDTDYFDSNDNADHIIAVADVIVNSITYSSDDTVDLDEDGTDDYDNAAAISAISIDNSSSISANDCSVSSNTSMACFIAPGNVASYNNEGTYSSYSALDQSDNTFGIDQGEYLGSAYVASAVSILTAAFPSVAMTNIVDKLITTAIPASDITGCDGDGASGTIDCGDGMINLFLAVQSSYDSYSSTTVYSNVVAPALHTSSFAGDFAYALADTTISSSLYFGDAFSVNAENILAKAKYFDSYNFDYSANLNSKVDTIEDLSASRFAVSDYFSFDDQIITDSETIPLSNNVSFTVTNSEPKSYESNNGKTRIFEDPDADLSDTSFSNLNFNQNLTKNIELSMGFDAYDANADIIGVNNDNFGSLAFSANNEYVGLIGDNSSYTSLSFDFAKNLQTQIGFALSEVNDTNYLYSKLNYDLGRSLISFSLGTLIEENNFLGTESEGAFNFDGGTQTSYYGVGYVKNMTNDIDFIAKLDFGISKIESDAYSVFSDFSDVTSRETSFALVKRANNSSYGLAYTEPMRVISGDVLVSVATARDLDGNVTLASERVSLVSSGKERNYELFFKRDLSNSDSLTFNYIYSTEPNHVATNPDEQLFAINFSKTF